MVHRFGRRDHMGKLKVPAIKLRAEGTCICTTYTNTRPHMYIYIKKYNNTSLYIYIMYIYVCVYICIHMLPLPKYIYIYTHTPAHPLLKWFGTLKYVLYVICMYAHYVCVCPGKCTSYRNILQWEHDIFAFCLVYGQQQLLLV